MQARDGEHMCDAARARLVQKSSVDTRGVARQQRIGDARAVAVHLRV